MPPPAAPERRPQEALKACASLQRLRAWAGSLSAASESSIPETGLPRASGISPLFHPWHIHVTQVEGRVSRELTDLVGVTWRGGLFLNHKQPNYFPFQDGLLLLMVMLPSFENIFKDFCLFP